MLMQEATPEMINTWRHTFDKYRNKLSPNKKTAFEIIEYLEKKYTLTEQAGLNPIVADNVILNEYYANKLPVGKAPKTKAFIVENAGAGKLLYEQQDDVFKGSRIIVGVELQSAYFMVEGSSLLWDELLAFRGLDEDDLSNFFLVAQYISCLERFDMLNSVLNEL